MAFPTDKSDVVDNVDDVLAAHINALETKMGVDGSAVASSLDYIVNHLAVAKIVNTTKARVYTSNNQVLVANTEEILELNQETFDIGSNFDTGTYKFTAPVTGYYQIDVSVRYAINADQDQITTRVKVGDTVTLEGKGQASGASTLQGIVSGLLFLTAADEVSVWVMNNDNADTISGGTTFTWMSIHLLSV